MPWAGLAPLTCLVIIDTHCQLLPVNDLSTHEVEKKKQQQQSGASKSERDSLK